MKRYNVALLDGYYQRESYLSSFAEYMIILKFVIFTVIVVIYRYNNLSSFSDFLSQHIP